VTTTPVVRAQRRYDPERKSRIVDAAIEVIAEHGVAGTTSRRIAAAADVPLGSLTYHFNGLDDLLARPSGGTPSGGRRATRPTSTAYGTWPASSTR